MAKYFFTFGSDERFPYGREDYVMVYAENAHIAALKFKNVHPNRPGSPFLNCADIYSEENFNSFRDKYYLGVKPREIIR